MITEGLPWVYRHARYSGEVLDSRGLTVARVDGFESDGRLMAAAPELLAALREALRLLERDSVQTGAYPQIRAAIAKAEGRGSP